MEEASEYERRRQENILANKALLQQLQLDTNSLEVSRRKAAPQKTPGSAARKKAVKKEPRESPAPRRTSSRLAGIPASSELAKRKAEDELVALASAENAKKQRVAGDLSFDLKTPLVDLKTRSYERTFTDEDVKATTDKDLKAVRQKMMGLKLYEKFEPNNIKVTTERIYHLAFHPTVDKQLIFAGDKIGNLGIFDASSAKETEDGEEEPNISQYKLHSRTISTFQFDPTSGASLYSSSYDGSVRKFDLATGVASEVFVSEDEDPLSGVEVIDENILYFSTLSGIVGRRDLRQKEAETWALSEKKIGGFALHPRAPHLAATASLDRTVKIWDLRKITGAKDEKMPVLVAENTSDKSVSCALWNAQGSLLTTSYDDTVKIYKFPSAASWKVGKELGGVKPDVTIRHNNQSGRWVTILRAQWHQSPLEGPQKLVIANMNRSIDIYADSGAQLAQLGDDSITAVPAVVQFHPTQDWVAGGTASGKLALWT